VPRDDLSSIAHNVILYFIIFSSRREIITVIGEIAIVRRRYIAQLYYIIIFIIVVVVVVTILYIIYIPAAPLPCTRRYIIRELARYLSRCAPVRFETISVFKLPFSASSHMSPVRGSSTVYRFDRDEYTSFDTIYTYPMVPFSTLLL